MQKTGTLEQSLTKDISIPYLLATISEASASSEQLKRGQSSRTLVVKLVDWVNVELVMHGSSGDNASPARV